MFGVINMGGSSGRRKWSRFRCGHLAGLFAILVFALPANLTPTRFSALGQGQDKSLANKANAELVRGSRDALIETGFSARYFDEHFRVHQIFDQPSDMRVVWRLSVNSYEALVHDAIGYYTDQNQKKVYVHSVGSTLGRTRDMTRTISRRLAQKSMRACIGRSAGEAVVLMRLFLSEPASLYMTAHAVTKASRKREVGEREIGDREKSDNKNPQVDQPENEETRKRPRLLVGYINLETGRCTKGEAVATP
jgi:hypothetical protein